MKNKILIHLALGFLRLLACLPFSLLYGLSNGIAFLLERVVKYRHEVTYNNLHRSFPEKSEQELLTLMHRYYRHMGDLIVETIKLLHISDRQMKEHVTVRGGELVERLAADGRPVICFLGHYGNWEWVQEISHYYRRPALNAEIYRPVKDPVSDTIMKTIRSRFDTTPIPQKQAVRTLLKMNQEGQQFIVGFIADQRPNSLNLHHWTWFLNQDTAYATGGEEIGTHLKAHFVYLDIEKPSRGHYTMTLHEMKPDEQDQEPYPYTRLFLKLMEQTIRRDPAYWLWSHNRWEFDREGNTIQKK